jgi:hypothetical protein
VILFRGVERSGRVIGESELGMRIEISIVPAIGEPVTVRRPGSPSLRYFVRWVRDGHIGIGCREDALIADQVQSPAREIERVWTAGNVPHIDERLARAVT